jgi:hypothetical protein
MNTSYLMVAAAAIALLPLTPVTAQSSPHHDDLRGPLRPRIGVISNVVALQQLRMAGLANPRIVTRDATRIVVQGDIAGQPTILHMDPLRGGAVLAADPRRVIIPLGTAAAPMVRGAQLRLDWARIADPALMKGAVQPR